MIQERINRVINNHQMSCGHTNHYLFILKGFTVVLDRYTVPIEDLDVSRIHAKKNFAITYEDMLSLGSGFIDALKDNAYDPWIVDFNLFEGGYLSNTVISEYTHVEPLGLFNLVDYPAIPYLRDNKVIHIFNTNNPLIGLVEDPELPLHNEQRLKLLEN